MAQAYFRKRIDNLSTTSDEGPHGSLAFSENELYVPYGFFVLWGSWFFECLGCPRNHNPLKIPVPTPSSDLSDAPKYCQRLPVQVLPDASRRCQMLPDALGCHQMIPGAARFCLMLRIPTPTPGEMPTQMPEQINASHNTNNNTDTNTQPKPTQIHSQDAFQMCLFNYAIALRKTSSVFRIRLFWKLTNCRG